MPDILSREEIDALMKKGRAMSKESEAPDQSVPSDKPFDQQLTEMLDDLLRKRDDATRIIRNPDGYVPTHYADHKREEERVYWEIVHLVKDALKPAPVPSDIDTLLDAFGRAYALHGTANDERLCGDERDVATFKAELDEARSALLEAIKPAPVPSYIQALQEAIPEYYCDALLLYPWLPEKNEEIDDLWRNQTSTENALWLITAYAERDAVQERLTEEVASDHLKALRKANALEQQIQTMTREAEEASVDWTNINTVLGEREQQIQTLLTLLKRVYEGFDAIEYERGDTLGADIYDALIEADALKSDGGK